MNWGSLKKITLAVNCLVVVVLHMVLAEINLDNYLAKKAWLNSSLVIVYCSTFETIINELST
jgi:hypothetical protein